VLLPFSSEEGKRKRHFRRKRTSLEEGKKSRVVAERKSRFPVSRRGREAKNLQEGRSINDEKVGREKGKKPNNL